MLLGRSSSQELSSWTATVGKTTTKNTKNKKYAGFSIYFWDHQRSCVAGKVWQIALTLLDPPGLCEGLWSLREIQFWQNQESIFLDLERAPINKTAGTPFPCWFSGESPLMRFVASRCLEQRESFVGAQTTPTSVLGPYVPLSYPYLTRTAHSF